MHEPWIWPWASRAASRSLAWAALLRAAAESAKAVLSLIQDSLVPLVGSFLPMAAASRAYSWVWGTIVSQTGGSASSSLPITGVSEFGPLLSLLMICLL